MHLLFICNRFPPEIGAHASSARRIAPALARLGHAVQVLAFADGQRPGQSSLHLEDVGLAVHRFGPFGDDALTATQLERLSGCLHRRQPFDAVWAHGAGPAGFLATWLGRRLGVPVLLAVRGDDPDRHFFRPGDFARFEWCLRSATLLAADSAESVGAVRALVGREALPLPHAVDGTLFCPGPRPAGLALRYGISAETTVLGFCGELRAGKGLPHLADAFRQVRAERPSRLLIIGNVAPDDRSALSAALGRTPDISRDVVRSGPLAEPAEVLHHLRLCDALLSPGVREGQPNAVLEAMAAGIPVIASDAGCLPELIDDGRTGLLVPRTSLHLFGRRVSELLNWPAERRQEMATAARAFVLDGHSPAGERQKLEGLLARFNGDL